MSSLKDIMDVDVEPLQSQAYRRSREAAQLQASLPPIATSAETPPPLINDYNEGSIPIKRRRSNRALNLSSQATTARQATASRRSSAVGEEMDYTPGFQARGSTQASKSGSPSRPSRGSEPAEGMPVKYTPVTGRISKAKKGVPVHTCDICRPVKTFTRAEHLRRHQLSHQKPAYPCTFEDCERAFHRPDLLSRHLHRHETQGEKAYKSEDPRSSRASSSASETRTPSLKVETPSQLPPLSTNHQGSSTDSMTPRTSGSGESSMTASSFSTITGNFQAVNFLPEPSNCHKRSATEAQLSNPEYSISSPGSARTPGPCDRIPDQNTFSRPAQPVFEEPYAEGGSSSHYPAYTTTTTTTPQLPLLRIPEETWVPGLSFNNSPWCSSASDSTYSAQSEGSRTYGRSGSISTLPDWPAAASAPHWPPHPMTSTPQDLRSPPFDPMLEQYDNSYASSPRLTPPLSARSHHLDVPTTYGVFTSYMESVGTPTLSTFSKPVAQNFPASPSRISKPGLEIPRRMKSLVESKRLGSSIFTMNSILTSNFQQKTQLDHYISSYWQNFHPLSPIIHRPTFDSTENNLLTSAMAAIGTQYYNAPEARALGAQLNESCKKGIERCLNWDMQTRQVILLTEVFTRFRGRKINVRLSRHFEELYSRLLNESNQEHPTPTLAQSLVNITTTEGLLERFGTHGSVQNLQSSNIQTEWRQFLETEARQRLLSACFMFDVHQSMCHQQPRSKAIRDNSRPLIHVPCPENIWNASNATHWQLQRSDYVAQPLHLLEGEISSQYITSLPSFTQSLLTCWYAAQLPLRENLDYPNDFLPRSMNPDIESFMSLFPTSPLAHTYLSLYHTPLYSLLAIACDTWVFGKKITPPTAFYAQQAFLKIWSSRLAAAQATHHACQILSATLSQPIVMTPEGGMKSTQSLSDYWSLYISALICWAFGNRYQNSGSNVSNHNPSLSLNSATPTNSLSRSSSTTELRSLEDVALFMEETRLKAMAYVNAMLEFSVEELLTGKASVKSDTQGVVEAVRTRLEVESTGSKCGLLVDACGVLGKIKDAGRGKWF